MNFGERIKNLRRNKGMTQEGLAELLSISAQAVSRWETGVAMPDISLLPPLSNLFGVTTDYLLGMDEYEKDARKKEYDEAFKDYWKKDDKEKNYRIALQAVAEYPGNMEYIEWLATAEFYVAHLSMDDSQYGTLLESAVEHYKLLLNNCNDRVLRKKGLFGIVQALYWLGRKNEAKVYAMMEEIEEQRNELLQWCLEGEEKEKHNQKMLEHSLNKFLYQLSLIKNCPQAREATEKILKIMFPDENYIHYHDILRNNKLSEAVYYCENSCYDEAVVALKTAKYHSEELLKAMTQPTYKYTNIFFDRIEGETPERDSHDDELEDFFEGLRNNRCYDPLRERKDFKELFKR